MSVILCLSALFCSPLFRFLSFILSLSSLHLALARMLYSSLCFASRGGLFDILSVWWSEGWITAWTGLTNHPDLQDSFSITLPPLLPLYKYNLRGRKTEKEWKRRETERGEKRERGTTTNKKMTKCRISSSALDAMPTSWHMHDLEFHTEQYLPLTVGNTSQPFVTRAPVH